MTIVKELYRTYIKRDSFEYIVRQLESIPLRGDDKILARAEKYRLQLELCNYFNQQLERLSNNILVTNPSLSAEYIRESRIIIEKFKKPITEYLLFLKAQNSNNPVVQTYVERNSIPTEMNSLAQQYKETSYENEFIRTVKLIDNYINKCKDKNI